MDSKLNIKTVMSEQFIKIVIVVGCPLLLLEEPINVVNEKLKKCQVGLTNCIRLSGLDVHIATLFNQVADGFVKRVHAVSQMRLYY